MKAAEIIRKIEKHCNEDLKCSRRFRYQLEQALQTEIDKNEELKRSMSNVLKGYLTFNPATHKAINKVK